MNQQPVLGRSWVRLQATTRQREVLGRMEEELGPLDKSQARGGPREDREELGRHNTLQQVSLWFLLPLPVSWRVLPDNTSGEKYSHVPRPVCVSCLIHGRSSSEKQQSCCDYGDDCQHLRWSSTSRTGRRLLLLLLSVNTR